MIKVYFTLYLEICRKGSLIEELLSLDLSFLVDKNCFAVVVVVVIDTEAKVVAEIAIGFFELLNSTKLPRTKIPMRRTKRAERMDTRKILIRDDGNTFKK